MDRRVTSSMVTLLLAAGVGVVGCGGNTKTAPTAPPHTSSASGTASQSPSSAFASSGNALCKRALEEAAAVPRPRSVAQDLGYLKRSLPIAENELTALESLHPPASAQAPFRDALSLSRRQDAMSRTGVQELEAGRTPATVLPSVQRQLDALDARVNADFRKAGLPECAK